MKTPEEINEFAAKSKERGMALSGKKIAIWYRRYDGNWEKVPKKYIHTKLWDPYFCMASEPSDEPGGETWCYLPDVHDINIGGSIISYGEIIGIYNSEERYDENFVKGYSP